MKVLAGAFVLALTTTVAHAQVTTTCRPVNVFMPSMGTTCDSTGSLPTQSTSSDTSGGAAVGAAAAVGLGVLIFKGAQAVHERRERERIERAAAMIMRHDCDGAVRMAMAENDHALAAKIPRYCKTSEQAGLEPEFLPPGAQPAEVGDWAKAHLNVGAQESLITANRDKVDLVQTGSTAPPTSLWIHSEALSEAGRKALNGNRSQLMLVAFDCLNSRFRIVATTAYAGQNKTGESRSEDHPSEPSVIRPGSVAETWENRACAVATPKQNPPPVQAALTVK